ncbi:MAG: hypothetical protein ACRDN0_17405 [Trebonia sp.]
MTTPMPRSEQGLLLVMMQPQEGYDDSLNRWYDEEHIPERLSCPGFLGVRRFRAVEGTPAYLALYDLDSPAAVHSQEYGRLKQNPTPWTVDIESHLAESRRNVYVELPRRTFP